MSGQSDIRRRLASLLDEVAVYEGTQRTFVEGVEVSRVSKPVPRAPVVYQPKILVVGQGRKRGYLGDEVYHYDAFNYLVLSVPLPAECETEASPEEPLLLAGRFEGGGLFQASLLPQQSGPRWRLAVVTGHLRAELVFPEGWPGPARLSWRDASGEGRVEAWESWDPWPALVEVFETALGAKRRHRAQWDQAGITLQPASESSPLPDPSGLPFTWQDAIRALELDDAARRSIERRRSSLLEYPEANEEVGFKGTMTLAGCGLLWAVLLLLILSRWVPWLGWAVGPLLGVFLLLQLLRWLIPSREAASSGPPFAREKESSR